MLPPLRGGQCLIDRMRDVPPDDEQPREMTEEEIEEALSILSCVKLPESVLQEIELPLVPVLSRIERNGALVSRDLLSKQSAEIGLRLDTLQKQAFELAGEEFNLASPKQLGHILFEKLALPVITASRAC